MNLRDALADGRARLAGVDDPGREARLLLAQAAGVAPERVVLLDEVAPEPLDRYHAMLAARAQGRPLARVLGYRDFWQHRFEIDAHVLDPRAETETLVARALEVPWNSVLDLGTGSGCVFLSLLSERPSATGLGTDTSEGALAVARRNAHRLGVSDRATLRRADWYERIDGRFDLIVSNPPYIAADEMDGLDEVVRIHDPVEALTDYADGLSAYRAIATGAAAHLTKHGWLMVEIGWRQRTAVAAIFAAADLREITCHVDLAGRDRVISARSG